MAVDGLQIYGNIFNPLEPTTPVGPEPTMVEDELLEEEGEDETDVPTKQPANGGMVSPESARYFGPEGRCMNCIHFMEPNSCEIVAGEISPDGICSLFSQDSMEDESVEIPADEGAMY